MFLGRPGDYNHVSRAPLLQGQPAAANPARIRSTVKEDLYLTYEGLNETTGRPIIKAHLNPLVMWIWVGVLIMIGGTVLALIPNAVPMRVAAPARIETAPAGAGD